MYLKIIIIITHLTTSSLLPSLSASNNMSRRILDCTVGQPSICSTQKQKHSKKCQAIVKIVVIPKLIFIFCLYKQKKKWKQ